ncbi:hypothetical protein B0H13DRAFT_2414426 [Mycena leptocephala]|nr:hypothetical protein B0H13DRAFT_2414426 [Mycena leptocephala]
MPWQSVSKTGFSPCAIDEPAQRVKMGRWEIGAGASKTHVASRKLSSALRIRPTPGRAGFQIPTLYLRFHPDSTRPLAHPLCLLICLESIVGRIAIETEPSFGVSSCVCDELKRNPEPLKVKSRLPGWRNTRPALDGAYASSRQIRLDAARYWITLVHRRGRDIRACAGGSRAPRPSNRYLLMDVTTRPNICLKPYFKYTLFQGHQLGNPPYPNRAPTRARASLPRCPPKLPNPNPIPPSLRLSRYSRYSCIASRNSPAIAVAAPHLWVTSSRLGFSPVLVPIPVPVPIPVLVPILVLVPVPVNSGSQTDGYGNGNGNGNGAVGMER